MGSRSPRNQGNFRIWIGGGLSLQVSFATEGGWETAVPNLSVEVDNLDEVLQRVHRNGIPVEYGPAGEPWGRRSVLCARSIWTFAEYSQPHLT